MYNNGVKSVDIARKLGVTKSYVSMVLNGSRTPKGGRERFEQAVEEIIKERKK